LSPENGPTQPGFTGAIALEHDRLTIYVQDQPLRAVIQEIATQGQIDVYALESLPNKSISLQLQALPVMEGLRRVFHVADVAGYVLVTAQRGETIQVRRIIVLPSDAAAGDVSAGTRGAPSIARALPPPPPAPALPAVPQQIPTAQGQRANAPEERSTAPTVFAILSTNSTARRLLNQVMHDNAMVRQRALASLVGLVRDSEQQRELREVLEPLLDALGSEEEATREHAQQEFRQLFGR